MTSRLNPYLNFGGGAREAMERYHEVLGGTLTVHTYAESGMADGPDAQKVMHAFLETEAGFTLMASDIPGGMEHQPGTAMAVSLSGDDADDLRRWWSDLSAGGTVTMAMEKQAWGDEFGMCIDRFGTPWMVNITQSAG